jgi:succinate-acetate transporter protein
MVLFCKITERPKFSEQIIIIIKGVILFLYFSNFTFYVLLRFQLQTSKFLSLFQVLDFTFFLFSLSFFTRSLSVKNSQSVSESRS